MPHKLPDSRTIPTLKNFDRAYFNNSNASLTSKKSLLGMGGEFSQSTIWTPTGTTADLMKNGSVEQFPSTSKLHLPAQGPASLPYSHTHPDFQNEKQTPPDPPPVKKGFKFWIIFATLNVASLLVAIDISIISTALPTISADLHSNELYVWIGNAYVLASAATQPLLGQAADIIGRRMLYILSIGLFMLGSALAGAAQTTSMIIGARTVQGAGGGGIIVLSEIIVNDLLPLRERPVYTGLIAGTYAIGTCLGPILGGFFTQHVSWRWVFFINLPICGVALVIAVPFLNIPYKREGTILQRLKRIDWPGNAVLTAAVTCILMSLTWGGTKYAWGDWHVTLPLYAGFLGLMLFTKIQISGWIDEPTMPKKLFANRTSSSVFIMSFFHGLILTYVTYYLPVYFQAVRDSSPTRSGVQLFPIVVTIAPAAALIGIVVTKTGLYRRWIFLGWALMVLGCGLFTLFTPTTGTGLWTIFQMLFGAGNGLIYNTMIPPLLGSLKPAQYTTATAMWVFFRSFGQIWGIAIPSAVFNTRVNTLSANRLAGADPNLAALLSNGGAYERATAAFIDSVPIGERATVISVYSDALKMVWQVSIGFAVIGLLTAFPIKRYELSKVMESAEEDTDVGMDDMSNRSDSHTQVQHSQPPMGRFRETSV